MYPVYPASGWYYPCDLATLVSLRADAQYDYPHSYVRYDLRYKVPVICRVVGRFVRGIRSAGCIRIGAGNAQAAASLEEALVISKQQK